MIEGLFLLGAMASPAIFAAALVAMPEEEPKLEESKLEEITEYPFVVRGGKLISDYTQAVQYLYCSCEKCWMGMNKICRCTEGELLECKTYKDEVLRTIRRIEVEKYNKGSN